MGIFITLNTSSVTVFTCCFAIGVLAAVERRSLKDQSYRILLCVVTVFWCLTFVFNFYEVDVYVPLFSFKQFDVYVS